MRKDNSWSIELNLNAGKVLNLRPHLRLFNGDEEYDENNIYFSSPHVDVIPVDNPVRAYYRMMSLLKLFSGINILFGGNRIVHKGTLYYFNGTTYQKFYGPQEDLDMFFQELNMPFDEKLTEQLNSEDANYRGVSGIIKAMIRYPLIRENLLLLTLGREQIIYILINAYKIIENIKTDLNLSTNNSKLKLGKGTPNITDELLNDLNNAYKYSRYINAKDASGLLCRHGATKITAPDEKPKIADIEQAVISALKSWINYKCNYFYGPII
ncbi:hypothetical protein [Terrilactibacillus laevilacticus]|uniref:HEPN domain-containing protein n=1 Tax=Terrilactibacillus laevilacticus TaxID=1380157 RepID=A0ABW5PLA1_9BACI|nr:hypothetical protein [Terrilactibacillus laevilacticus]